MERLITQNDVADFLNIATADAIEPKIAVAEGLVAEYIQTRSLHARVVNHKVTIPYDLDGDESIELRDGPVASLESFSIDSQDIDLDSSGESEDLLLGRWSVKYLPGLRRKSALAIRYVAGYTPRSLPPKMKSALIMATGLVIQNPNVTVAWEQIGDYQVSYGTGTGAASTTGYALNARLCLLLSEFCRPSLFGRPGKG